MTWETIGQFLQMYWVLIAALGGFAWWLVANSYEQKGTKRQLNSVVIEFRNEIMELKDQMKSHDEQDKLIEANLTNLINRNRDRTEDFTRSLQNKLEHMSNSIIETQTYVKMMISKKD